MASVFILWLALLLPWLLICGHLVSGDADNNKKKDKGVVRLSRTMNTICNADAIYETLYEKCLDGRGGGGGGGGKKREDIHPLLLTGTTAAGLRSGCIERPLKRCAEHGAKCGGFVVHPPIEEDVGGYLVQVDLFSPGTTFEARANVTLYEQRMVAAARGKEEEEEGEEEEGEEEGEEIAQVENELTAEELDAIMAEISDDEAVYLLEQQIEALVLEVMEDDVLSMQEQERSEKLFRNLATAQEKAIRSNLGAAVQEKAGLHHVVKKKKLPSILCHPPQWTGGGYKPGTYIEGSKGNFVPGYCRKPITIPPKCTCTEKEVIPGFCIESIYTPPTPPIFIPGSYLPKKFTPGFCTLVKKDYPRNTLLSPSPSVNDGNGD